MYKTKKITLIPQDVDLTSRYELCNTGDELSLYYFNDSERTSLDQIIFFGSVDEMRSVAQAMLEMCGGM